MATTLDPPAAALPWHAQDPIDVAARLGVDIDHGLTRELADRRLRDLGPNRLAEAPKRPAWQVLVDQFRNLLVGILLVAAVLAAVVGDWKDTAVIAVVLIVNALLGFLQEHRAERSLAALRSMLAPVATVRRDGSVQRLDASHLVPGDVVLVEAGDRVPADGRIVAAVALEMDEASLTGESLPAPKSIDPVGADAGLGDRRCMAHMNSMVTRGRGEIVVTDTGMQTEIGRVAGLLAEIVDAETPLQRQLNVLGKRLAAVAGVAVVTFATVALARGEEVGATLLGAVALAVAAIPEGLPAVVTVTLALGVQRLAARGAIVKRLASVETLGATTVICSDKTGTLTQNRMAARVIAVGGRRFTITGDGYGGEGRIEAIDGGGPPPAADLLPLVLCNDSRLIDGDLVGDPTEGALAAIVRRLGIDPDEVRREHPRLGEVPFDSTRKLMATFHGHVASPTVSVKGALDVVAPRCTLVATPHGDVVLDEVAQANLEVLAADFAGQGLRVIAFARGDAHDVVGVDADLLAERLEGLVLVGLVGLLDPPRHEAADAVAVCRRAGIDVKMITGDHATTAEAIARSLGIDGPVRPGSDLDDLDDDALVSVVRETAVFARVAPEHKVRIVRALQGGGEVVAMTGDGVNDAPALKAADIGVAMGVSGTEVSKEAAAMVLTDDNFATIVRAVEGGRAIHDNIAKFVRFQLSTNVGAILSLIGAPLLGMPVPFTAIQVLWVNLIMDGPPAMALGVDPPARDAMARPPRDPAARILDRTRLVAVALGGTVMGTATLGMLAWQRSVGSEAHALAMAFTTFVLLQLFNVFSSRNDHASALSFESLRNRPLLVAVAAVAGLQVLAVHLDVVQRIFGTADLAASDWLVCVAAASSVLWVDEIRKFVLRRHTGRAAARR